jgi:hypothetical protein
MLKTDERGLPWGRAGCDNPGLLLPTWWALPADGGRMKRVNDFEFYRLAASLQPLGDLPDGALLSDAWSIMERANGWLDHLIGDALVPLVVTKPAAIKLRDSVQTVLAKYKDEGPALFSEVVLQFSDLYPMRVLVRDFETVLSAELQSLATYFVSQKLAYETRVLIEEAERILPHNIVSFLLPKVIEEIRQAGRCVAFDIPTAATFHIIRATECVIRMYYEHAIGRPPKVKSRNWGAYIKNLRESGHAKPEILSVLDHIREAYRNPILHPEVTLNPDEAQVILGICASAICQMVLEIQQTPRTAPLVPTLVAMTGNR